MPKLPSSGGKLVLVSRGLAAVLRSLKGAPLISLLGSQLDRSAINVRAHRDRNMTESGTIFFSSFIAQLSQFVKYT